MLRRFCFFLDGYDELSFSVKDNVTKDILKFTKLYNQNCYLITSKPYTNIDLLTKFSNFEVCELNTLPEERTKQYRIAINRNKSLEIELNDQEEMQLRKIYNDAAIKFRFTIPITIN